jgi:hypothetical protein
MLNQAIIALVRSFDDDQGLPEAAYEATCEILLAVNGAKTRGAFQMAIKAQDGRYYLHHTGDVEQVVAHIIGR